VRSALVVVSSTSSTCCASTAPRTARVALAPMLTPLRCARGSC